MANTPIKVSQLTSIPDANIDDKDLFLVSDSNNKQFYSRQMTMKQLREYIAKKTLASDTFKKAAQTAHLYGSEAQWESDAMRKTKLLKGQIAFVKSESANTVSMKVGDGVTPFEDLPYVSIKGASPEILVDTTANWRADSSFKPAKGQIVIWSDKAQIPKYALSGDELVEDGTVNVPGIKIGDGNAFNVDLPFVGDEAQAKLDYFQTQIDSLLQTVQQHIADEGAHVSAADRRSWNHKITLGELTDPDDDGVDGETLVMTRN